MVSLFVDRDSVRARKSMHVRAPVITVFADSGGDRELLERMESEMLAAGALDVPFDMNAFKVINDEITPWISWVKSMRFGLVGVKRLGKDWSFWPKFFVVQLRFFSEKNFGLQGFIRLRYHLSWLVLSHEGTLPVEVTIGNRGAVSFWHTSSVFWILSIDLARFVVANVKNILLFVVSWDESDQIYPLFGLTLKFVGIQPSR